MLEVLAESMVLDIGRGDSEQAKGLLRLCSTLLRRGLPLPTTAAEYLAGCLDAIEQQPEPWGVPLLRRARGQKSAVLQQQAREIAMEYWVQTAVHGVKGAAAELELAGQFGVTVDQVKHAWKKHRRNVEEIDTEDYRAWLRDAARDAMGE